MATPNKPDIGDVEEIEDLRARLDEAEETLRAIRSGEVDAVVVTGPEGPQVYSLTGAETVYRNLVEAMNEGALLLTHDGTITYCNQIFAHMIRTPLDQIIGMRIHSFIEQPKIERLDQLLTGTYQAGANCELTLTANRSYSMPVKFSVGDLGVAGEMGISAVVTDLTYQKRAEEELDEYRTQLEEMVAERTAQLSQAKKQLQEVNEELAATNEEMVVTNEDLTFSIEALRLANDELAKSREQEAFRASELESVLTGTTDGIALIDSDGGVRWMNDSAREMLGLPQEFERDWMGRYGRQTLDGRALPVERTPVYRALRGERVQDERHILTTPYGGQFFISVTASPIMDTRGNVIGATTIFRDIREQVESEGHRDRALIRERHIAQTLQAALLPPQTSYHVPGCRMSVQYQSSLDEAQVGGDFYDVFELEHGKIGVLIGDVAGKGLAAAIRVASARWTIRSYAYLDSSPAVVMARANDALCKDETEGTGMLTAVFAVLNVLESVLTYSSGGHEPQVLVHADGRLEELDATGCALGVIEGCSYAENTYRMIPGDRVVMYTDGITESRVTFDDMFGVHGVLEYLSKVGDSDPEEIGKGLLNAARTYGNGELRDDVAIVVIEMTDESRPE